MIFRSVLHRRLFLLLLLTQVGVTVGQSFPERIRLFIANDFSKANQLLTAACPVFYRDKNVVIFQTTANHRGIDAEFPLHRTVTHYYSLNENGQADSVSSRIVYGSTELILIGSNASGDKLLFTDYACRTELFLLDLTVRRTNGLRKIGNFYNGGYAVHSATLSSCGRWIVFSSARPGSKGGYDLFLANLDITGNVNFLQNAGTIVNSAMDEIFPRFTTADTALVFASNAHHHQYQFQLCEVRFSNGKFTARNVLVPCNTNLESVCRFETIDSTFSLATTFSFSKEFVNQWAELSFNRSRWRDAVKDQPFLWEMLPVPLKGVITANGKKVSEPVEVSLLDSTGNLIAATVSRPDGTYRFAQTPKQTFLVLFSSACFFPTAGIISVPSDYKLPCYIFDVSLRPYDMSSRIESVSAVVSSPSPLQKFEWRGNDTGWSKNAQPVLFVSSAAIEMAFETWIDPPLAVALPAKLQKKPLITITPKPLPWQGFPVSVLVNISDNRPYPKYTVFSQTTEGVKPKPGQGEYTVIVGKAEDVDPYRLMQFATLKGVGGLRINRSINGDEYCLGGFESFSQAQKFVPELIRMGFSFAQVGIMDYSSNRFIPVNDRRKRENRNGGGETIYVEVYASVDFLPVKTFPFSEKIAIIVDKNGVFHYIYPVENPKAAAGMIQQLRRQGFNATTVRIEIED